MEDAKDAKQFYKEQCMVTGLQIRRALIWEEGIKDILGVRWSFCIFKSHERKAARGQREGRRRWASGLEKA